MPARFSFIEQYRTMAKDLEKQSCEDFLSFDQEVPQSRNFLDDSEIKSEVKPAIKLEAVDGGIDMYNIMDCMENSSTDAAYNSNQNYHRFLDNFKSSYSPAVGDQSRPATAPLTLPSSAATARTSGLSLIASTASPLMSSTALLSLTPFSSTTSALTLSPMTSTYTTTKTSTYVTELAGSGCTVVSNTDFLFDSPNTLSPFDGRDENLEYTNLDKPMEPLNDDYSPFSMMNKQGTVLEESDCVPLEAVFIMTDTIQSDCNNLNVPYDPMIWSPEHVKRWVSWVCHRNQVSDVSHHLCHYDGRALCSLTRDYLSRTFHEAGIKISNELDLLKAAYSCFSNQSQEDFLSSQHLYEPFMENPQTFSFDSCVSPAPSLSSSTHDSSSSTVSTHSDHSDDESGYGSQKSSYSNTTKIGEAGDHNRIVAKVSTGRGHKQTIHLWQFLKELLLSKENNYSECIRWQDRKAGIFKIEDSKKVASLWGARKNRPAMNYDKLSRSVRQYYKKGIIKKTEQSKRLVYQFCPGYL
ncbi:unnamed protein product [Candidula unifasciata]|uniref:Uncharacterized protein n=1 Tax=Candidula unifasciata TaxID=100452 RepID=A0A8S3YVQ5_9EUPU|nr:unnamed protein product [Candidula unifasciata]